MVNGLASGSYSSVICYPIATLLFYFLTGDVTNLQVLVRYKLANFLVIGKVLGSEIFVSIMVLWLNKAKLPPLSVIRSSGSSRGSISTHYPPPNHHFIVSCVLRFLAFPSDYRPRGALERSQFSSSSRKGLLR